MGLYHPVAGEVVNLQRLNEELPGDKTIALVKTETMEVLRVYLSKDKSMPAHSVSGELTVQCLSGKVQFDVEGEGRELQAGDWLFLNGNQEHALYAVEESVVLVTIQLN